MDKRDGSMLGQHQKIAEYAGTMMVCHVAEFLYQDVGSIAGDRFSVNASGENPQDRKKIDTVSGGATIGDYDTNGCFAY
jgi:hypothetical protein